MLCAGSSLPPRPAAPAPRLCTEGTARVPFECVGKPHPRGRGGGPGQHGVPVTATAPAGRPFLLRPTVGVQRESGEAQRGLR